MENLIADIEALLTLPNLLIAGATVLLLFWLWSRIRAARHPAEITAFSTPNGTVGIARSALCDLVDKVAVSIDGVNRCASRVTKKGALVNLQLRVQIIAGTQLTDVVPHLERRVAQTLRQTFGLENLGAINTLVTGFTAEAKSKKSGTYKHDDTDNDPLDAFEEERQI